MHITFESIQDEHLKSVLEIYTHYVLNTTATFHKHVPSLAEMKELVFFTSPLYQTFVVLEEGKLCGYVILTQHKKREAYDTTAEVTIYLRPESVGKGIGKLALQKIEAFAATKEIHALVATICGENTSSIALFERNGYTKCAHYREVGRKFDQWLDLVAYEKIVGE